MIVIWLTCCKFFDDILGKNTRNQYFINFFAISSLMIVLWLPCCKFFDDILGKNTRNQYFINFFATSSLMIVDTFTHLWITKHVYETMYDIWI